MNRIKAKIAKAVERRGPEMRKINRAIFERPELCYREEFASGLVMDRLREAGFRIENPVAGLKTAFRAVRRGRCGGPAVAIIAEYDALPQMGHACGHSMIAASAVGAAAAIAAAAPDHPGSLMVIGTPAEEGGGGKIKMIRRGVFRDVDAAIMIHPSNKTRVVSRMYAINDVEFTFTGRAAHAAAFPHEGVNALDAAVLFYNAVSMLRQQMKGEARVHGIITHGGDAPNIIPEKAAARFYVRALDRDYFQGLVEKVKSLARGAAKGAGCGVRMKTMGPSYDPFYPSHPMGEAFRENMAALGIAEDGFSETEQIGSSDIGNLSQAVPALHPEYAIGGREVINHSRRFLEAVVSRRGEAAMIGMTKAMAGAVHDLLTRPGLMARVKKEFAARKKG